MKSKDLIFIITLNYNQNQYTLDCIQSILKSDYENFILFLIDNGSTHDNFEELKIKLPKDERLILQRIENNIGYVGGVNFGLKKGLEFNPTHFVIMNNDTIIDSKAISALYECCVRYDNKAIVAGKIYDYEIPNRIQSIGSYFNDKRFMSVFSPGKGEIDIGKYEKILEMDMIDDILWIMPSGIIQEVGCYSKHFFFGGEQSDYVLRAKLKGYKMIYNPEAIVWHKGGASFLNNKNEYSTEFTFLSTKGSIIFNYRNLSIYNFLYFSLRFLLVIFYKIFIKPSKLSMRINLCKLHAFQSSINYIYKIGIRLEKTNSINT